MRTPHPVENTRKPGLGLISRRDSRIDHCSLSWSLPHCTRLLGRVDIQPRAQSLAQQSLGEGIRAPRGEGEENDSVNQSWKPGNQLSGHSHGEASRLGCELGSALSSSCDPKQVPEHSVPVVPLPLVCCKD